MTQRILTRRGRFLPILALLAALCLVLTACGGDEKKAERKQPTAVEAPRGNTREESFLDAKRALERAVYHDHRITLYCRAPFDAKNNVQTPPGFTTPKHKARAGRVEWEHVVPAENFGRAFVEWREGHPDCRDKRGPFKGRKCAERTSREYRLMQADMYNLYPAIGAVNAMRSNDNYAMLPDAPASFGTCGMKIAGGKAEPPEYARGTIARSAKYMAWAYPRYRMSDQQAKLMDAWDAMYPVDEWECVRARRIEGIQGNENPLVKGKCEAAGFWN